MLFGSRPPQRGHRGIWCSQPLRRKSFRLLENSPSTWTSLGWFDRNKGRKRLGELCKHGFVGRARSICEMRRRHEICRAERGRRINLMNEKRGPQRRAKGRLSAKESLSLPKMNARQWCSKSSAWTLGAGLGMAGKIRRQILVGRSQSQAIYAAHRRPKTAPIWSASP